MALADLVVPTRTVESDVVTLTVRGLCFNDLTVLFSSYSEDIDRLVDDLGGNAPTDDQDLLPGLTPASLLRAAPELVAHAIALACDEPDHRDKAAKLPLGAMLDTMMAVWDLTLESAGGFEKLMGTVMAALDRVRPMLGGLPTGIETSPPP